MQATQYHDTQAATLERQFMQVFSANESKPKRIESRIWPDGVRTDGNAIRPGSGVPFMKSVVVR